MLFKFDNLHKINPNIKTPLLEIILLKENPNSLTDSVLIYCPPIVGKTLNQLQIERLCSNYRKIYEINILKYGYLVFDEYIYQAKLLIQSQNINIEKITLIGFSTGTSFIFHLGISLNLEKNKIVAFAPIISFNLSRQRIKAWMLNRKVKRKAFANDVSYLEKLLKTERLYSKSTTINSFERLKILNFVRKQWTSRIEGLKRSTVVNGKRDFISPPNRYTSIIIDSTHSLDEYLSYFILRYMYKT